MRRNCNLELRLDPGWQRNIVMEKESSGSPLQQQQQLTIFYNGNIVVCDVTELQARSILLMANREVEERMRTPTATAGSVPASPTTGLASPMCTPPGLSMKKSLQRFLQKRQHRLQATSPYNH